MTAGVHENFETITNTFEYFYGEQIHKDFPNPCIFSERHWYPRIQSWMAELPALMLLLANPIIYECSRQAYFLWQSYHSVGINSNSFSPLYWSIWILCYWYIIVDPHSFESVKEPVKIVLEAFKMKVLNAGWRDIFNNDHTKPFTSWVKNVAERNDQNKNCTIIMLTSEKDTKNKMFLIGGLTEPSTFYASHNQGFEDTYISTQ